MMWTPPPQPSNLVSTVPWKKEWLDMSGMIIGLDLAKSVFQVHAVDAEGKVVITRKVRRSQMLEFFTRLEPCLVGMEACPSAHHWARELSALGHEVRLMVASYVKPYVKRQKNDMVDAEAICEAVTRPTMRFVPIKSESQQAILMVHRTRALLVRQRTMLVNALRGHLTEMGVVAPKGIRRHADLVERVLAHGADEIDLPPLVRDIVFSSARQIGSLNAEIKELERKILEWHRTSDASQRLATIPGVGVITASAMAEGRARVRQADCMARPDAAIQLIRWQGTVGTDHESRKPIFENLACHRGDSCRRFLETNNRGAINELGQKAPPGEICTPDNGGLGQQDGTDLLGGNGTQDRLRRSRRISHDALASQQFGGSAQEA